MVSVGACIAIVLVVTVSAKNNDEVKACMKEVAASTSCIESCKASVGSQVPDTNWTAVQVCFDHQSTNLGKCTSRKQGLLNDSLPCMGHASATPRNTREARMPHDHQWNVTGLFNHSSMGNEHDNQAVGGHGKTDFGGAPKGWNGQVTEPGKCLSACRNAEFEKCFEGCTASPPKLGNRVPQWNPIERCQSKEALKACLGRETAKKDH